MEMRVRGLLQPAEGGSPMKGTIFTTFEAFVSDTFGSEMYETILDNTELETIEPFVGPGTYPAGDLMALVTTAIELLDISLETALIEFGKYAFPKLATSIPDLMARLPDAQSFFLGLESVIHTEVRKLDAQANPARFTPEETSDGMLLHYESTLGLFPLVTGFIEGVAAWYGEPIEHHMVSSHATNASFKLTFPASADAASPSKEAVMSRA